MANKKKKKAVASVRSYATTSAPKKPVEAPTEESIELTETEKSQNSISVEEEEWEKVVPLPSLDDIKRKDELRVLKMQVDEDYKRQLAKINKLYADKNVPQLPLTDKEEKTLYAFLKSVAQDDSRMSILCCPDSQFADS